MKFLQRKDHAFHVFGNYFRYLAEMGVGGLTFAACGNSPQSQSISRLLFGIVLSVALLTNSESLLGVEGREPEGLKKNTNP